jgi:acyl-CoA synthetase (AMP-forming)/AMP-acid ligase II
VSTAEVGGMISGTEGIEDVAVYGVEIPGCDGKAGMAAIKLDPDSGHSQEDVFKRLHASLTANLPAYARPLFVRIQKKMALTSTFKHQKNDLVAEGYDPAKCKGDDVFLYSTKDGAFKPVTESLLADINNKKVQF